MENRILNEVEYEKLEDGLDMILEAITLLRYIPENDSENAFTHDAAVGAVCLILCEACETLLLFDDKLPEGLPLKLIEIREAASLHIELAEHYEEKSVTESLIRSLLDDFIKITAKETERPFITSFARLYAETQK